MKLQENMRSGCLLSQDASPVDQLNIRVKALLRYNIDVSLKGVLIFHEPSQCLEEYKTKAEKEKKK